MFWNRSCIFLKATVIFFCLPAAAFFALPAFGAEEWSKFLDRLEKERFYEYGVYYLEKNKEKLPDDLKKSYEFRVANMRVGAVGLFADPNRRLKEYEVIAALYLKFLKEQADHPMANEALARYPLLIQDTARAYIQLSKGERLSDGERKQWLDRARAELEKGEQFLESQVGKEGALLNKAKAAKKAMDSETDSRQKDKLSTALEELTTLLNFLRFCRAGIVEEQAETYPPESKEWSDKLDSARAQFRYLWDMYSEYMNFVALNGRLREGQILLKQKKMEGRGGAIEVLNELAAAMSDMLDDPLCVQIYTDAMGSVYECYFTVKVPDDNRKELIERYTAWDRSGYDRWSPAGLTLQANYAEMLGIMSQNEGLAEKDKNAIITRIKKVLEPLLRRNTDQRARIEAVLEKYTGSTGIQKSIDVTFDPKMDFMEVVRNAKKFEDLIPLADAKWKEFVEKQQAFAGAANVAVQRIKRDELTAFAKTILPIYDKMEVLKQDMLSDSSKQTQLTFRRYCRALLLNYADQQLEGTVLLNFLIKNYPQQRYGVLSMDLITAWYADIIGKTVEFPEMKGLKKQELQNAVRFELTSMVRIAKLYKKYLKEHPESEDVTQAKVDNAWGRVCTAFVRVKDVTNAKKYLDEISADGTARADAEGSVGVAIWKAYNTALTDEEVKASEEELHALRKDALEMLNRSYAMQKKAVAGGRIITDAMIGSALNLCQILNLVGNTAETLNILQDSKLGPYTLFLANDPIVERHRQTILIYALQAFVVENQTDEAEKVMDALEQLASEEAAKDGGNSDIDEMLTKIYIRLGRGLEENIKQIILEGRRGELDKMQKGFEMFLGRIKEREAGNTFNSLMWVAQTYIGLADGLSGPGGKTVSPKAKEYYDAAIYAFYSIGARLKDDPEFSPRTDPEKQEALKVAILERIAECHAKAGDFDKAIQLYAAILMQAPSRVGLQITALDAMMRKYHSLTENKEKADLINKMLAGDIKYKDPNSKGKEVNAIHGWQKIHQMTKGKAPLTQNPTDAELKYREYFFTSVVRFAQLSVERARINTDKKKKDEHLAKARGYIEPIYNLYPDLGSKELYAEYEKTFDEIQAEQGVEKKERKILKDIYTPPTSSKKPEEGTPDATRRILIDEQEEDMARKAREKAQKETAENDRKMAEIQKKQDEADPTMMYILLSGCGVFFIVVLYLALRKRRASPAELRRKAEMSEVALTEIPSEDAAPASDGPVALEGLGGDEPVVTSDAATDIFASLGLGDVPVSAPDENTSFDFAGEKPKKPAAGKPSAPGPESPSPEKKPSSRPAGTNGAPVKKPVAGNGKPVSAGEKAEQKPGGGSEGKPSSAVSEKSAEKQGVKPVVKPITPKPAADKKPEADLPSGAEES